MTDVRITNRLGTCGVRAALATLGLFWPAPASAQVSLNGRMERIGSFQVVRVWGDPPEMGFAHGYLLAKDIVADLQTVVSTLYGGKMERYEATLASLKDIISVPPRLQAEIEGVFEGIQSVYGAAPEMPAWGRRMKIEDLIHWNAFDVLRAFGCSGFAVWHDRAGEAGVIAGRTFDFPAFSPDMLSHQFILIREPSHRAKIASVTWPGYVGAFTAINHRGVAIFLHDGNGRRSPQPTGQYVPMTLVMMDILEQAKPENTWRYVRNAVQVHATPFSYLVRVVAPWTTNTPVPSAVFRRDADAAGFNPAKQDMTITTNHYLADNFTPQGDASEDSVRRYKTLETLLSGPVTPIMAWNALGAVASADPNSGTLHALVFYPERRRLELSFAQWTEQAFIPATLHAPTVISFDELFKSPQDRGPGG